MPRTRDGWRRGANPPRRCWPAWRTPSSRRGSDAADSPRLGDGRDRPRRRPGRDRSGLEAGRRPLVLLGAAGSRLRPRRNRGGDRRSSAGERIASRDLAERLRPCDPRSGGGGARRAARGRRAGLGHRLRLLPARRHRSRSGLRFLPRWLSCRRSPSRRGPEGAVPDRIDLPRAGGGPGRPDEARAGRLGLAARAPF